MLKGREKVVKENTAAQLISPRYEYSQEKEEAPERHPSPWSTQYGFYKLP